jgi:hypothetical protein
MWAREALNNRQISKRYSRLPSRLGALLPSSIRVLMHGMPVSSQATSSQSMIAFLTGRCSIVGFRAWKRLV